MPNMHKIRFFFSFFSLAHLEVKLWFLFPLESFITFFICLITFLRSFLPMCSDCGGNSFSNSQMHYNFPQYWSCMYFFQVEMICSKHSSVLLKLFSTFAGEPLEKEEQNLVLSPRHEISEVTSVYFKVASCNCCRSEAPTHIISWPFWERERVASAGRKARQTTGTVTILATSVSAPNKHKSTPCEATTEGCSI